MNNPGCKHTEDEAYTTTTLKRLNQFTMNVVNPKSFSDKNLAVYKTV